jgi:WD40 repeat protein
LWRHFGEVLSLALSVDGKRLYSANVDNTIKVWDLEAELRDAGARGQPKKAPPP